MLPLDEVIICDFLFEKTENHNFQQECIPVGCILPTCRLYTVVFHVSQGSAPVDRPEGKCLPTPWMQTPSLDVDLHLLGGRPPGCRPPLVM